MSAPSPGGMLTGGRQDPTGAGTPSEEVPACDQGLGVTQSSAPGSVSVERGRRGKAGTGGALAGARAMGHVRGGPCIQAGNLGLTQVST